jgi:dTDP-4-amino-4,6-dideoxygalactose transaminase
LGSIGHMSGYSFHETKNVISGEGGALLINDTRFVQLAEIVREKGTDRSRFYRGEVDKYTWQHIGSSYLPSELMAAFLYAQLEEAESITTRRRTIWNLYHHHLAPLEDNRLLRRPVIPDQVGMNAHLYYVLVKDLETRTRLLATLQERGILAIFHYVPLHLSPAGTRYGRVSGDLKLTESLSQRIVRLPLWIGMDEELVVMIVSAINEVLLGHHS